MATRCRRLQVVDGRVTRGLPLCRRSWGEKRPREGSGQAFDARTKAPITCRRGGDGLSETRVRTSRAAERLAELLGQALERRRIRLLEGQANEPVGKEEDGHLREAIAYLQGDDVGTYPGVLEHLVRHCLEGAIARMLGRSLAIGLADLRVQALAGDWGRRLEVDEDQVDPLPEEIKMCRVWRR
jgi:hypothetical protein